MVSLALEQEEKKVGKHRRVVVRMMARDDVPLLVRLHREVFQGYDNTMMGNGYLKNLYLTLACHSSCVSIVTLDDDEIVGWIGGVWDWLSFQRALSLRNVLWVPGILCSILKNKPLLLVKAFSFVRPVFSELTRRRRPRAAGGRETSSSLQAALLVIGVIPKRQKQGVGQSLMESFEGLLLSRGFTGISASTFTKNAAGNRIFQNAGYSIYRTNSSVNYYSKRLIR
jgi:hypothetical protein